MFLRGKHSQTAKDNAFRALRWNPPLDLKTWDPRAIGFQTAAYKGQTGIPVKAAWPAPVLWRCSVLSRFLPVLDRISSIDRVASV